MILTAIGLELRTLARSPLRLLVVALVLGTGLLVVLRGQQEVTAWEESLAAGEAEAQESLAEARACFEEGRPGPEDRPWIDLSAPRWQDWYAGTRLARQPAALASIAHASAEAGAVTVRVNRYANPLLATGSKIENPALAVTGGLDLVTVLTLLLPLLVLALGVEVGSQERSMGILPLIRVQSGRDRSWIVQRCLAIGLLVSAVGLTLCLAAGLAAGAGLTALLPLIATVLAYVAFWTALLATIALVARHPSQGAVALGSSWIALCVVIPALGVSRSASLAAGDFGLDLTVEARDAGGLVDELADEELLAAVFERFPALEGLQPEDVSPRRGAEDAHEILDLERRLASREVVAQEQSRLVEQLAWLSPAIAFSGALEGLAGRGPEAAREYRQQVVSAAATRMESYVASTWRGTPLDAEDFEALVRSSATTLPSQVTPPTRALWILALWTVLLTGLASQISRTRTGSSKPQELELRAATS